MSAFFDSFKRFFCRKSSSASSAPDRSDKKQMGRFGEDAAADELKRLHYTVLHRNYRIGGHEVDIIAKSGDTVIFCEVKTRTARPDDPMPFGRPAQAVTKEQRRHLFSAARAYLSVHARGCRVRFDIAEVYLNPDSEHCEVLQIKLLKDAFRP